MNWHRRRFLQNGLAFASLGLLAGCGVPQLLGSRTQITPRLGFLAVGTREGRDFIVEGLLQGLREHGYVEGQSIDIEYRFSDDRDDRLPQLAAELVALNVDVIVTSGTPASFSARDATSTIPIVLGGVAANPVETGLVASLARPGGNITGMTNMSSLLGGKRLQLLKEIMPSLARVAVFWNPPNPSYEPVFKELDLAAQTLGIEIQRLEVRSAEDFEGAFDTGVKGRAEALVVPGDPLTANRLKTISEIAARYRLPTMMEQRQFVEGGGLLSLGADLADLYRRSATHVDKILKGIKPAELPMEQPTKLDIAINLKTAQDLGLVISESILGQATEVIA